MNQWRDYSVLGNFTELVSPYLSKENRVYKIRGKQNPKHDVSLSPSRPVYEIFPKCTKVVIELPPPRYLVKSSGKKWFVEGKRAAGITVPIKKHLGDRWLYRGLRRQRRTRRYHRYCAKSCLRVGIAVDKELKEFASGSVHFTDLVYSDSQNIIAHLANKHISLISSAVVVTNWTPKIHDQELLSGTEIDLVGFDHMNRNFVVIEIKITGSSCQDLSHFYRRAKKDKLSGFRKCILGQYEAQLVCTLKMFQEMYDVQDATGLLVICEHRNSMPFSLSVKSCDYDTSRFSGWISGYE